MAGEQKYYLVRADALPEVFLRVMEAKELLETNECRTVAEAVDRVGISRSAFYKYRDAVSDFRDLTAGRIVTYHVVLRDRKGLLSALLTIFAEAGANILTINQSIPSDGAALVVISASEEEARIGSSALLERIRSAPGVIRADVLAG